MPFPTLLANRADRKGNSCLSSCMMGLRTIAQGEIIDNRFRNHLLMVVNGTRCEVRPPGFASRGLSHVEQVTESPVLPVPDL